MPRNRHRTFVGAISSLSCPASRRSTAADFQHRHPDRRRLRHGDRQRGTAGSRSERSAFQIDDNGKRQTLTLFAHEIQPITVVILLDRSGSMRANFELVEQAAEQFVAAMRPADKARIGSFATRIQIDPRDFTSDRDELVKILRRSCSRRGRRRSGTP